MSECPNCGAPLVHDLYVNCPTCLWPLDLEQQQQQQENQ